MQLSEQEIETINGKSDAGIPNVIEGIGLARKGIALGKGNSIHKLQR